MTGKQKFLYNSMTVKANEKVKSISEYNFFFRFLDPLKAKKKRFCDIITYEVVWCTYVNMTLRKFHVFYERNKKYKEFNYFVTSSISFTYFNFSREQQWRWLWRWWSCVEEEIHIYIFAMYLHEGSTDH